jgi:colicin import membrane protein
MNFLKKITQFFSNLFSKKSGAVAKEKDKKKLSGPKVDKASKLKAFAIKALSLSFKYLKKFINFVLRLIKTMMQPMIRISKKHPIAFWAAVILHLSLLFGLLYANVERWEMPQQNSNSQAAPVQAVMIDMEIIEAEQDRLKDVEKQKKITLKNQEKRSETAKKDQKVAEQEALKAKAKKVMAEVQRKSEEAKTKEAKILASKANEIIAGAETKTKIELAKAKEAEVKRISAEAKSKEVELLVKEATKQKEAAQAERKAEEVKTKLAEIKRKVEEAKTKEAEILAKEAEILAKEAEILAKEATAVVKEAQGKRIAEEEKAKEAEILVKEVSKQIKEAKEKRKTEEERAREAEEKAIVAEKQVDIAKKLTEEEQQKKNELEAERAAQQEAFEKEQYVRLLTQEVQAEQDMARTLIIEDQLNTLKTAYVNNIAARVRTYWRYQGADDDWSCNVYVQQDENGVVEAVNIQNCNLDDSEKARAFKNSIERAVYKASPLPSAPDEAVFDREILFEFGVN